MLAIEDAGAVTDNCSSTSVSATGGVITTNLCSRIQEWTVTAVDACENETSCVVTYTWTEDLADPEFTNCPDEAISLGCNPTALPSETQAIADAGSAMDNCGTPAITATAGNILINNCSLSQAWRITATDACGNSKDCIVIYNWTIDEDGPVFTACPTEAISLG